MHKFLESVDIPISLLEKIKSKVDNTIKYIFKSSLNNHIFEVAYINKNDGKDILCVSTQTFCNLGCKFCHTTDYIGKIITRNLTEREITNGVFYVYKDLNLNNNKLLLVSYMGCGEPTHNHYDVFYSMVRIKQVYPNSRFAIATLLPKKDWQSFYIFVNNIKEAELPVKLHLSLHFVDDILRKQWMPNALPVRTAISALEWFHFFTNNSVEVHYTLISGVNDHAIEIHKLKNLLFGREIPVKFLKFNEKPTLDFAYSPDVQKIQNHIEYLQRFDIFSEYYTPPGIDVGASCGQFLFDYYLKYNIPPK